MSSDQGLPSESDESRRSHDERDKRLRESGATRPRSSSKTQRQQAQDRLREAGATKSKLDAPKSDKAYHPSRRVSQEEIGWRIQKLNAGTEAGGELTPPKPGSIDAQGNMRGLFGK